MVMKERTTIRETFREHPEGPFEKKGNTRMIEPERDRHVDTLMSVFDLRIHRALCLPKGISTRVFYLYDKKRNIQQFRVLNRNMSGDIHSKIEAWLEENILDHDVIARLVANEMDADTLSPGGKPQ